jgi:DNA-binding MarR family transcriptional regulator
MATKSDPENTVLRLWLLLHRVRDVLVQCEDSVFSECGITLEQFTVLGQVKGQGGPMRIIDLARVLERGPNSVSTLVDRMVKAGLVKRTRGKVDRRVVRVSLTSKGENAIKLATPAGWEFAQKILSPISSKDKDALASILETVKCEAFACIHPELDRTEIIKRSVTNQPDLYERMGKNLFPFGSEAKRQRGKRKL